MSLTNRRNLLRVESLERRDNPAASLNPVTGLLTVNGDDPWTGVDDRITLDTYPWFVRVTLNATITDFPAAKVKSIRVDAKTGTDVVYAERVLPTTPVTVLPGSGTNSVVLAPSTQD
jgi:hypothetical protein